MSEKSNNPFKFWEELKRREVIRVIIGYLASAYVLLELTSIVAEPLGLPDWTIKFVIILLCVGFIIAIFLSWVFDITPGGLKKTESAKSARHEKRSELTKRKLMVSNLFIGILLVTVMVLAYPRIFKKDFFSEIRDRDGRISVAVMPFNNLTVDSLYNIWQQGLQNLLITSLSNSEELSVKHAQPINDIIGINTQTNYASIIPSLATGVATKLEANTVIIGNIHKAGNKIRISANLIDSKTEELYKSFEVDGDTENDFFIITDSLSGLILNFLETESLEQKLPIELTNAFTSSVEAYKNYIKGRNYHGVLEYNLAVEQYNRALEIDSSFVWPMLYLTHIYRDIGRSDQSRKCAYKAFSLINEVPVEIQLEIRGLKAMVDKKPQEQLNYINQYLQLNPYSTQKLYTVGWINYGLKKWNEAIEAFEKGIKLNESFESKYRLWVYYYTQLGSSYSNIGEQRKAFKTFDLGLEVWPDDPLITYWQAVCAISIGDVALAEKYLDNLKTILEDKGWPDIDITWWTASCYELGDNIVKAEELYRSTIGLSQDNLERINQFAYFLIVNDIDVDEGLGLISTALTTSPDYWNYLYTYGLGLYKKEQYQESHNILSKSWDLRPSYLHDHFLLLQEVEHALSDQ